MTLLITNELILYKCHRKMDYILNSQEYFYVTYANALHDHYIFLFPENVLYVRVGFTRILNIYQERANASEGVSQERGRKHQKGGPRKGGEGITKGGPRKAGASIAKGWPRKGGESITKGPCPRALGQIDFT